MMHLQILLPTDVLVDVNVVKIVAEAENGSFCLLPRHVDFVTSLTAGILTYTDGGNEEHHVGLADGILVKSNKDVRVSVQFAVSDAPLGQLQAATRKHFEQIDDRERRATTAVARLEADFIRRYLKLERRPYVG